MSGPLRGVARPGVQECERQGRRQARDPRVQTHRGIASPQVHECGHLGSSTGQGSSPRGIARPRFQQCGPQGSSPAYVRGHSKSLKMAEFGKSYTTSRQTDVVPLSSNLTLKNVVTLMSTQGHWKWQHSIDRIQVPIRFPL